MPVPVPVFFFYHCSSPFFFEMMKVLFFLVRTLRTVRSTVSRHHVFFGCLLVRSTPPSPAQLQPSSPHSYQERAATGAAHVSSRVVGRSRDLYAKTKSGDLVRIFLTVKRVDRPSRTRGDRSARAVVYGV